MENTCKEICAICPSQELAENVRKVCREAHYENVSTFVAVLDDGLKIARKVQKQGARVLVSRKGTAGVLQQRSGMQVVQIRTTMNDYLRHIRLLKDHPGKLGIVEYSTFIPELEKLCEYVELPGATLYPYDNSAEYEKIASKAVADGNTLLIGGGVSLKQYASEAGIPHQIVENTLDSIRYALESAQQLVALQKHEQKKQWEYQVTSQRLSMILNNTNEGILSADRMGRIQVANQAALQLLKRRLPQVSGMPMAQILPELGSPTGSSPYSRLVRLHGGMCSVDHIPLKIDGNVEGALYILRNVRDVQRSEHNIRMQLYKKGNRAKYHFEDIQGKSSLLEQAKQIASSYSQTDSTVLVCGETGTGKELFAQSIHNASSRAAGPFVAINCASLGKELLESQLFGYVEGAFTGAAKGGRPGLFEIAHGGTIFLDEIGEIPMETQTQLLRVLQEKEIRRIGSDHTLPVDVRVITATNRNLAQEVDTGHFRRDLYYRINILRLTIPPLRERKGDVMVLAEYFLQMYFPQEREAIMQILRRNRLLEQYTWPGNIRELMGLLERMAALWKYGGGEVAETVLRESLGVAGKLPHIPEPEPAADASGAVRPDRAAIEKALELCHYHRGQAARMLGCSRSTLWRYMKQLGI